MTFKVNRMITFINKLVLFLSSVLLLSCSARMMIRIDDINKDLEENSVYIINRPLDLKGNTIYIPVNCTLVFTYGGSITNGVIMGKETKLRYTSPFIGDNIVLKNCKIEGKRVIKDYEVFLTVSHRQYEIQTLFDISDGIKIVFSPGSYNNVEKIEINNNVEAFFNNSEIRLRWESDYVAECFYMEPWINKGIDYVRINDLKIIGKRSGFSNGRISRRCLQFFYVSEVVLNHVTIDKYYGGPNEYDPDSRDLLNKTRIGTSTVAIINYDKCVINNCVTNDIYKEIFWCVPNVNPNNITYFTNNTSTSSAKTGSASFFTILDGRCIVKNNKVYNYNGSAFNVFCYDSEISHNLFIDGKRSAAVDLSEGTMYMARNVHIHNNKCINSKGLVAAFGSNIKINNNLWKNDVAQDSNQCTVVYITSRGSRTNDGRYIGCDNNPEQLFGSRRIVICDNYFDCSTNENEVEIRGAWLRGEDIVFKNNRMKGLNVPVIQLFEGNGVLYNKNVILNSKIGNSPELLINNGTNVEISDNTFSRNYVNNGESCTVQMNKIAGFLRYKKNHIALNSFDSIYTPCSILDYSKLEKAEIYVNKANGISRYELGIDSKRVSVSTNL